MEFLFDDSDQHIGGNGAPDLRLHCVLARAQKASEKLSKRAGVTDPARPGYVRASPPAEASSPQLRK